MAKAWKVLESAETPEGRLELRRRGDSDVLLTIGPRVLMNSHHSRSEVALANSACGHLRRVANPRVLIGGLGLGFTARAALDLLPSTARLVLAEIDPTIVRWYREHIGDLTGHLLDDPRVDLSVEDVANCLARTPPASFDAVIFDLYEGPSPSGKGDDDELYGPAMLRRVKQSLGRGGVFAVWAEQPSASFATRLRQAGFAVELTRPGRGALRHAVYLAKVRS